MSSATTVRIQIESALARKIPSALTPAPRTIRPVVATGIETLDELLHGGLPVGSITEIVGPESSGRTSMALSFVARTTEAGKVCAWIDVCNALHPESAAAAGVGLERLLWVRCGVQPKQHRGTTASNNFALPDGYFAAPAIKRGLHGGGFGPHPRTETKGLSNAIGGLFRPETIGLQSTQHQPKVERQSIGLSSLPLVTENLRAGVSGKPWARIEQALRVTDLLLQAGGFSALVLDMGSIAPEFVSRVPLATWFRYRAAAERSQASILLLTQHACAKSSAGLVLRLANGDALQDETTVFSGMKYHVDVVRERFSAAATNVIPMRKPPQRESGAGWRAQSAWVGLR